MLQNHLGGEQGQVPVARQDAIAAFLPSLFFFKFDLASTVLIDLSLDPLAAQISYSIDSLNKISVKSATYNVQPPVFVFKNDEQCVKSATIYKWTPPTPVATTTGGYSLKIKHQLGSCSSNKVCEQQRMWLWFPEQPCSNTSSNVRMRSFAIKGQVDLRKGRKLDLPAVWLLKKKETMEQNGQTMAVLPSDMATAASSSFNSTWFHIKGTLLLSF